MNTAEIVSVALSGSAVLSSGIGAVAIRCAVQRGYSVNVAGPSLKFEPPAPKPAVAVRPAARSHPAAGESLPRSRNEHGQFAPEPKAV